MPETKIDGNVVDLEDPCALYQALYAVKLKLIAGENVQEMSIQSPTTRETVIFSAGKIDQIDKELMRLSAACEAKSTGRRPSRRWKLRY